MPLHLLQSEQEHKSGGGLSGLVKGIFGGGGGGDTHTETHRSGGDGGNASDTKTSYKETHSSTPSGTSYSSSQTKTTTSGGGGGISTSEAKVCCNIGKRSASLHECLGLCNLVSLRQQSTLAKLYCEHATHFVSSASRCDPQ